MAVGRGALPFGSIYNDRAYLTASSGITICDLENDGTLSICRASGQTAIGTQLQVR